MLDRLSAEKYILLTTFRKDGRAVPTPVWAVRDGEALAVWTRADSGKVKRIRHNGDGDRGALRRAGSAARGGGVSSRDDLRGR